MQRKQAPAIAGILLIIPRQSSIFGPLPVIRGPLRMNRRHRRTARRLLRKVRRSLRKARMSLRKARRCPGLTRRPLRTVRGILRMSWRPLRAIRRLLRTAWGGLRTVLARFRLPRGRRQSSAGVYASFLAISSSRISRTVSVGDSGFGARRSALSPELSANGRVRPGRTYSRPTSEWCVKGRNLPD